MILFSIIEDEYLYSGISDIGGQKFRSTVAGASNASLVKIRR